MKKNLFIGCILIFFCACRQDQTPSIDYDLNANTKQVKTRQIVPINKNDSILIE